jgi:type I restriction enzyme S subunit
MHQAEIESFAEGSTGQTEINRSRLCNDIEISYPVDKIEQLKVVKLLFDLDERIKTNNQINDNLLQQCTLIYDSICIDAEYSSISNLIYHVESGTRPKGGAESSGIPSIGAEKIEMFGKYDYSNEKYISEEFFRKMKRGIVKSGDVLLYKDGAYTGKSSMALDHFPHTCCAVNEHVFILRTQKMLYQSFLYFTLQNNDVHQKLYSLACGKAAQPGLNQTELLSVDIKLPDFNTIEQFENQVRPMMHQIALNAMESKKLAIIRDTLLPKLMSGEIDVSDIQF